MQNLLDIPYEQYLWNVLKYIGSTKLLGTGFLLLFSAYSSNYQMIRNVGKLGLSLKEKSAKVCISLWPVAKYAMYYGILI